MYSADYVWSQVIVRLEQQLSAAVVASFLDDASVIEFTGERLVLYSPTEFRRSAIREKLTPYIEAALTELLRPGAKLTVCGDEIFEKSRREEQEFPPRFTFDSFITGPSNRLAAAAARTAAHSPGQVCNPLFLYGPPGVGKTHLLYAIAAQLRSEKEDASIVFIKGEEFVNELISAITRDQVEELRRKYRTADLFLIDDIHFIAGKEATQEEFFNTFNKLYEGRRQIVVTSVRRPGDMPTLEARLRSRFEGGLIAEIQPPDLATRIAVLEQKAAQLQLPLPKNECAYIAGCVTGNIRQLEGVLKTLQAYRSLDNMPLDMEHIEPILSSFAPACRTGAPDPAAIIR